MSVTGENSYMFLAVNSTSQGSRVMLFRAKFEQNKHLISALARSRGSLHGRFAAIRL